MHKRTDLASGPINGSDRLIIELIESESLPAAVAIIWPPKPTSCEPAQLDAVVAAAMRVLAHSVVTLAGIRAHRKL